MNEFDAIGERIEGLWRAAGYDEGSLPSIASKALSEASLYRFLAPENVLEWAVSTNHLPEQRDLRGDFGQPPITVFARARFHIDVYFWFDGTTSIHQHGFSGAFQVLSGSSLHTSYRFDSYRSVNSAMEIGKLEVDSCELLQTGDIRQIASGRDYIHSLFHLDQPSSTIIVRTNQLRTMQPQWAYERPSFAVDPLFEDPWLTKKLQCLGAMFRAGHSASERLLDELIEAADLHSAYRILRTSRSFSAPESEHREQRLLALLEPRFGKVVDGLRAALRVHARTERIVMIRGIVTDPELRFFLALLMNLEERTTVLEMVARRFAGCDPVSKVLDWVEQLARIRVFGPFGGNPIGLENFDHLDSMILEGLLKEMDFEEISKWIGSESTIAADETMMSELRSRLSRLGSSELLGGLLGSRG